MDKRLTWPGTWQVQKTKGIPDVIATRKQNLRSNVMAMVRGRKLLGYE
jgi:hypothetical protein